jgi:hypothetical protein
MDIWKVLGRFGSNILMAIISASVIWMGSSFYSMTVLLAVQQSEFKTMNDNFSQMSSDFSEIKTKLDQYALKADLKDYEARLRVLESEISKMEGKLEKQPIKLSINHEKNPRVYQIMARDMGLTNRPNSVLGFPYPSSPSRPNCCRLRPRCFTRTSVRNWVSPDVQRCRIRWHPPEFLRTV